ncbi:MAG: helix-turn-helix domain-containing protein [Acidobacteriota bacterium]|jgi:transcriptional regulator with XRE-family HTH domain
MIDIANTAATDREIMQEIGRRLRELRRRRGLTMIEVGERAELDRTTVSRAEQGDNPTLLTLVRVLRVYGRLPALEAFVPEPEVSPMARLEARRRREERG